MDELKTPEEVEKYWTDEAINKLVGKKITKVQYLSKEDQEIWGFYERPLIIVFDYGSWIMPMSDDEGNDGGALATSFNKLSTIPVI